MTSIRKYSHEKPRWHCDNDDEREILLFCEGVIFRTERNACRRGTFNDGDMCNLISLISERYPRENADQKKEKEVFLHLSLFHRAPRFSVLLSRTPTSRVVSS